MKLPRDLSGRELGEALGKLGYTYTRQTGSHRRYLTQRNGEHYVTIPDHPNLRTGTINAVIRHVALHHGISRSELLQLLFG